MLLLLDSLLQERNIGSQGGTLRRVLGDLLRLTKHSPPTSIMPSLTSDIVKGVNNCSVEDRSGRPFVVSIEGNIGSGKSTMLKYFEKFQDVELVPEPVAEWCDVGGHNLLGKLYEDPKRWSFQFQSYVQLTRLQLLKKQTDCSVKIIERSIQNNRFCFLENARREGSLSGSELEVLIEWYKWLDTNLGIPLDLIVYLRTSPQVAYDRLRQRGRKEESGVPMQFIEGLHQSYEDWLIHQSQATCLLLCSSWMLTRASRRCWRPMKSSRTRSEARSPTHQSSLLWSPRK